MTKVNQKFSTSKDLQTFLRYLDLQYNSLRTAGADNCTLTYFSELIKYLKSRTKKEKNAIFPSSEQMFTKEPEESGLTMPDNIIRDWPLERVETLILENDIGRKDLERVAKIRFGLTKGAISSLTSKEALKHKLETLARNERGHDSIKRLTQLDSTSNNGS
jgi:hypothetical protein